MILNTSLSGDFVCRADLPWQSARGGAGGKPLSKVPRQPSPSPTCAIGGARVQLEGLQ